MTETPNPYATPLDVDRTPTLWEKIRGMFTMVRLRETSPSSFAKGQAMIFGGIAFFVDPNESELLYAASPSSVVTDSRMDLITHEAKIHLNGLLAASPSLKPIVQGRRLVVRIIDSYSDDRSWFREEVQTGLTLKKELSG